MRARVLRPARAAVATLLLPLVFAAGCMPHKEPDIVDPTRRVEVRGKDGRVLLSLQANAIRGHWVAARSEGWFDIGQDGRVTLSAGGHGQLGLRAEGGGLVVGEDGGATRLRVTRVDAHVRVGDGQGLPLGRIRRDGEGAVLHDAGGMLTARAAPEGGRTVVSDRDGRVLGYVVGVEDPERSICLFLPKLGDAERALVAVGDAAWPR